MVTAIAAAGLAAAPSCESIECHGENESGSLLRSIPAPDGTGAPDPAAAPDGGSVVRQTWTIEPKGDFTVSQTIERKTGRLGAEVIPMDPKSAGEAGAEAYTAVLVRSVDRDGPAARGGILPGDAIVTFDGKEAASPDRLAFLVEGSAPGAAVDMGVLRKGQVITIEVVLGAESRTLYSKAFQRSLPVIDDRRRTGLKLAEMPDDVRAVVAPRSAEKGLLVVDLLPGGPAFQADIKVRDLVVALDGHPVPTIADWSAVLGSIADGTRIPVRTIRKGAPRDTTIFVVDDAETSAGFNLLGLVKYRREPSSARFGLIWGLLFHGESCSAVKRGDGNEPVNWQERGWGLVLDLVKARRTPTHKELRLLWIFPITFKAPAGED
jgi:hypothetical protein